MFKIGDTVRCSDNFCGDKRQRQYYSQITVGSVYEIEDMTIACSDEIYYKFVGIDYYYPNSENLFELIVSKKEEEEIPKHIQNIFTAYSKARELEEKYSNGGPGRSGQAMLVERGKGYAFKDVLYELGYSVIEESKTIYTSKLVKNDVAS